MLHLNRVIGPIGNNTTMPILEDFLFELNQDELTITATDLETTITTTLNVHSSDNGVFFRASKNVGRYCQNHCITNRCNSRLMMMII